MDPPARAERLPKRVGERACPVLDPISRTQLIPPPASARSMALSANAFGWISGITSTAKTTDKVQLLT
jgi:hypothetical protein